MVCDLIRIQYAQSALPESWIFHGGAKDKNVPIIFSVFLIITKNKRILVDAGCETMPGFEMQNFRSPLAVMREQGIDPETVTDVILTHAHHDHIECVKYFPNAVIHIQEEAYAQGKKYLAENRCIQTFREETTVDGCVKIVKVGGHSVGSCVVEFQKDGKTCVLCGDECYCFYNLRNRVPTARTCAPDQSRAFIEKYTAPGYECFLCHDLGE